MAKIIVVSSSKGGVGKSTISILMANYLTSLQKPVAVLDADEGQTIAKLRELELKNNPDAALPWQVWDASENAQAFMEKAKSIEGFIIVDCPGTINQNLLPFFKSADVIVVPFRYDDVVILRTMDFMKILNSSGIKAKQLYLPNCIDVRVKNPNEEAIKDMFRRNGGHVLPRIKQGVAVQRVSTLRPIDQYQTLAILHTVNEVLGELIN